MIYPTYYRSCLQFSKFKSILVIIKVTNFVTTIPFFSSYSLLSWPAPLLKPTVITVDTVMAVVDTVDTAVDTDTVDTADTVMVDVTTDRFY